MIKSKKKGTMIKSLRKMTGAGNSNNAPPAYRHTTAGGFGLEDEDEYDELQTHGLQTHQGGGSSPGATVSAVDHMNVPSLRPGAPTELHQAVLSHDWDGLRARLGILEIDDALSIPSSQGAENGGDTPNKGDGDEQQRSLEGSVDKAQPTQHGRKRGGAAAAASSNLSSSSHRQSRATIRKGLRPKKSDGSPSARGLLTSSPATAGSVVAPSAKRQQQVSPSVKKQHCLSRDEGGRTPLHLILLRYTGGSLKKRTLRLRRAPDDVILGLMQLDPRAGGVPDREGLRPLHVAAREGHGFGVIDALLESFPGSAAESDESGKFPIDYALEYACQNARKKKSGGGEDTEDARWHVVKRLLQASPEAASVNSSMLPPQQSLEDGSQPKEKPPLLLQALSKAAPESVIRLLIPSAAPYFSSRHGVSDACTALFLAVANQYSLGVMTELESICPSQARSVRDETGMGLVAASYVVWAYGDGSKSGDESAGSGSQHWTKLKDHRDMMLSITKARDDTESGDGELSPSDDVAANEGAVPRDFHEWWCKTKFWIMHYRPETGFPTTPHTRSDGTLLRAEDADCPDHLLHAALLNPDTPSQVVYLILRLHPSLASIPSKINQRLPLHISSVTPGYTARHYEERPLPYSTIELVYKWHPSAIRVRDPASGRLPLHLALWEGRKTWMEGVGVLVGAERKALRVRDWSQSQETDNTDESTPTGLYPFQMAAVGRPQTDSMKVRFAYMARNCHTNAKWRAMSVRQRAAEVMQIQAEYDLEVLGTVFELLRSDPCVLNNDTHEAGTNVKLLAMRWGARARSFSKDAPDSASKADAPTSASKGQISVETTDSRGNEEAFPLEPSSAINKKSLEEVPDMFASPRSLNTDFTDDSYGPAAARHALQFVVEEGEGKVTTLTQSPYAHDLINREENLQHPRINVPAPTHSNSTNHPNSPDATDSTGASPAGTLLLPPDWFAGSALGSPTSQELSTTSGASSDLAPQGNMDVNVASGMPRRIANNERSKDLLSSGGKSGKKSWFKGVSPFKNRRVNESNDFKEMTAEEEKISKMLDYDMKIVTQQLTTDPNEDEDYWFISDPSFSPSSQDGERSKSTKKGGRNGGRPRTTGGGAVVNKVVGGTVQTWIKSESEVERLILMTTSKNASCPGTSKYQQHRLGIFAEWMNAYNVDEPAKETIHFDSKNLKSRFLDQTNTDRVPVEEISLARTTLETQATTITSSHTSSQKSSQKSETRLDALCLKCTSRKRQMLILPCRHMCLCGICAKDAMLGCCPMCQKDIHCTVEVYV